jgi:beta-glucuronidase
MQHECIVKAMVNQKKIIRILSPSTLSGVFSIRKTRIFAFFFFILSLLSLPGANSQEIDLSGKWSIATDLNGRGVENDWHEEFNAGPSGLVPGWDVVEVPHSFTLDSRYNITGKVWYRRSFMLPENIGEKVCRIRFGAVFYKVAIWVNNQYIGTHEGGYTSFTYDLTNFVKPGVNFISVQVDNRWDAFTVPAARTGIQPKDQVYPWYEYGGITGEVNLLVTEKVFITNQKIESKIDHVKKTATIDVKSWVNLYSETSQPLTIEGYIAFASDPTSIVARIAPATFQAVPFSENSLQQQVKLKDAQLKLWHFDDPQLYIVTTLVKSGGYCDTFSIRTGLRTIEAKDGQLLLNGQPVRMGGANRHRDYPGYGSLDPLHVIETDMELMKSGNMVLARLHHYPANEQLLDWADENGMLIIQEIPVWQWSGPQLIDPLLRAKVAIQAREMVERDWNRPSVIGWSGGNEYSTWTPEGDSYTRFITDFFRSMDNTRLATIVSHMPSTRPENISAAHNSFRYCDLICINYYIESKLEEHLERIHSIFPDKPLIITEFGKLSLQTNEDERIRNLMYYLNTIRKYPYVAGLSWWTINDYLSRWPGTNPEGYRNFGLVDETREKRETYEEARREFCPLVATLDGNRLLLQARKDFPSFTVKDYLVSLRRNNEVILKKLLPVLSPGMSYSMEMPELKDRDTLEIISSGGYVVGTIPVK